MHQEAVSGKSQTAKEEVQEVADSLRRSGAGVNSDETFEESGIYVHFMFFSEINGVIRGQPSVSPPALLDMSVTVFQDP